MQFSCAKGHLMKGWEQCSSRRMHITHSIKASGKITFWNTSVISLSAKQPTKNLHLQGGLMVPPEESTCADGLWIFLTHLSLFSSLLVDSPKREEAPPHSRLSCVPLTGFVFIEMPASQGGSPPFGLTRPPPETSKLRTVLNPNL